jgi:hypothetical protein
MSATNPVVSLSPVADFLPALALFMDRALGALEGEDFGVFKNVGNSVIAADAGLDVALDFLPPDFELSLGDTLLMLSFGDLVPMLMLSDLVPMLRLKFGDLVALLMLSCGDLVPLLVLSFGDIVALLMLLFGDLVDLLLPSFGDLLDLLFEVSVSV